VPPIHAVPKLPWRMNRQTQRAYWNGRGRSTPSWWSAFAKSAGVEWLPGPQSIRRQAGLTGISSYTANVTKVSSRISSRPEPIRRTA